MKTMKFIKKIRGLLQSNRGFSLVEAVVSLALLAIIVVLIGNLLMTGYYMIYTTSPKSQKAAKLAGNVAGAAVSAGSSASSDSTVVSAESGSVTITFNVDSSILSATLPGTYQNGAAPASGSSGSSGSPGSSSSADVSFWTFNVGSSQ